MERGVGGGEEGVGGGQGGGRIACRGNAEARASGDRNGVVAGKGGRQLAADAVDNGLGGCLVGHAEQQAELVAAQPGHEVVLAQAAGNRPAGRSEYGVSRGVAVRVVDALEMVQVEHGQAEPPGRVGRTAHAVPKSPLPRPTIRKPGERISQGLLGQPSVGFSSGVVLAAESNDLGQEPTGQAQLPFGHIGRQVNVGRSFGADANHARAPRRRRSLPNVIWMGRIRPGPPGTARARENQIEPGGIGHVFRG